MSNKYLFKALALAAVTALSGCASKSSFSGSRLGSWEKEARMVSGSTRTPKHSLPKSEYPFDEKGNYISSWAAKGEGRFGKAHSTWASITTTDPEAALASEVTEKPGH